MSTFITRMDISGQGPRLAVKDLIDVAGIPTTAGCRAVADTAEPAASDAPCLAGARAADARIVGKVNLNELAMTPTGVNPWFGTPVNPLAPDRLPGGSSSGSAAAVGADEADVAYGTDTGGSVRIPAACCGVAGLKTTFGRISVEGVWPLGKSLDSVGPLARDLAGIELGMRLLEPGFVAADGAATTIGRIPTLGDPVIEAAINEALRAAGFEVVVVELPELDGLNDAFVSMYFAELWEADHELLETRPEGLGAEVTELLTVAPAFVPLVDEARAAAAELTQAFVSVFNRVELLALPTLPIFAPRLDDPAVGTSELTLDLARHTPLANVTGLPALAMPVPTAAGGLPASLQLIGPHRGEELLVATGAVVEAAVA
jgi:amidase